MPQNSRGWKGRVRGGRGSGSRKKVISPILERELGREGWRKRRFLLLEVESQRMVPLREGVGRVGEEKEEGRWRGGGFFLLLQVELRGWYR